MKIRKSNYIGSILHDKSNYNHFWNTILRHQIHHSNSGRKNSLCLWMEIKSITFMLLKQDLLVVCIDNLHLQRKLVRWSSYYSDTSGWLPGKNILITKQNKVVENIFMVHCSVVRQTAKPGKIYHISKVAIKNLAITCKYMWAYQTIWENAEPRKSSPHRMVPQSPLNGQPKIISWKLTLRDEVVFVLLVEQSIGCCCIIWWSLLNKSCRAEIVS